MKKTADENPNYVGWYKEKLKEKDAECRRLQARIKRLLAKEYQGQLMEERFEEERRQMYICMPFSPPVLSSLSKQASKRIDHYLLSPGPSI